MHVDMAPVEYNLTKLFRMKLKTTIGEGNGNPLQHSCLGNRRDRGGWGLQ